MSQGDHRRPMHDPHSASRVFSGEAVVISPAENTVRMFNTVGSRIWELADGSRTVSEIAAVLAQEYEVTPEAAHASVDRFMTELVEKGLLTFSG
jgi:predicted transcriptional regulator